MSKNSNGATYKLFLPAIFITLFVINNGFIFAQSQCASYSSTHCETYQKPTDITVIDPISGNECIAKACADSCPPKSGYFCDPNSSEPIPEVEKGSKLIYPAYTCVNYTCIGIEAPLPQVEGTNISSLDTYFKYVYQIGLGIVGIAALTMIVIGGAMYMTSAGNASQKSEAKDRITSAVLGLILALSAYLILYTINPDLVKLTKVQLQYPPLPMIVLKCDTANNICKAEEAKIGEPIADTCGEINAPCVPACQLTNASWNSDEMIIGEEARLTIEMRGKCDNITLGNIEIYEYNAVSSEITYYKTSSLVDKITPSAIKTGFPFHTSQTNWFIKAPEYSFLRKINIFEGKLDYWFRASFTAETTQKTTKEYFIESGITKVGRYNEAIER